LVRLIKPTGIILATLAVQQAEAFHWIMWFSLTGYTTEFGHGTPSGDVQSERRQLRIAPDDVQ
jgi:hypothetical protein